MSGFHEERFPIEIARGARGPQQPLGPFAPAL
jgi:hypothetical protein